MSIAYSRDRRLFLRFLNILLEFIDGIDACCGRTGYFMTNVQHAQVTWGLSERDSAWG